MSVLAALDLPRSTWYYHQSRWVENGEKYRLLRGPHPKPIDIHELQTPRPSRKSITMPLSNWSWQN